VRCRDALPVLLSPKFGAKSSHIFTQSPWNVTLVYGIDCLACQDELYMKVPLDVKDNVDHALRDSALNHCRIHREIASGQKHDSK
jgi:hypothetical protein